eukprot:g72982.t1
MDSRYRSSSPANMLIGLMLVFLSANNALNAETASEPSLGKEWKRFSVCEVLPDAKLWVQHAQSDILSFSLEDLLQLSTDKIRDLGFEACICSCKVDLAY